MILAFSPSLNPLLTNASLIKSSYSNPLTLERSISDGICFTQTAKSDAEIESASAFESIFL